jgi:hypothetical protein
MMMFAGQMACEAFNLLLKRWIKEERPKRMDFAPHQWSPCVLRSLPAGRDVRKRLRYALLAFAIRRLLLDLPNPLPALTPRAYSFHDPFTNLIRRAIIALNCRLFVCCGSRRKSCLPQLPHSEASSGRICSWCLFGCGMVRYYYVSQEIWLGGVRPRHTVVGGAEGARPGRY